MKKAFTLIELVIVIVVIGIIAAFSIPRLGKSDLIQASDQLISNIRYTQHLALIDDKFDPTDKDYFKKDWRVNFYQDGSNWWYKVGSGSSDSDLAKDPLKPEDPLKVNLSNKFKISNIDLKNADPSIPLANSIIFDDLGSPVYEKNGKANKLDKNSTLKITKGKECISIIIEPITGYAHVLRDVNGNIINCFP